MVYATCEEEYELNHTSLKGLCDRIGIPAFFEYFERNWHKSQDRWVMYRRAALPHLKNHTNNRLESFSGKLKDGIDSSMSMAQCVNALLAYDLRVQNEQQYRVSRIGQFVNSNYDEEMANVLRFTTHYVAEHISHEYARALANATAYRFVRRDVDQDLVKVKGAVVEHTLHLSDWRCDCEVAMSMRLPCRHAIAYRKVHNTPGPLIPWIRIDQRWTSSVAVLNRVKQFAYERFGSGRCKTKNCTQSDRYRHTVQATHLIASELADIDDDNEFDEMLQFVLNQWRNVRQRKMIKETQSGYNETSDIAFIREENDKVVKAQFGISSSEEESDDGAGPGRTSTDTLNRPTQDECVKIKLNPTAKKVGAPRKLRKTTVAGEKCDRKWFAAAEAGRKKAGEVTLNALIDYLDHEQPGLIETQRRLSGVIVKFTNCDNRKPKFKRMKNHVLIMDPFYILPSKLLNSCIKVLPLSNVIAVQFQLTTL